MVAQYAEGLSSTKKRSCRGFKYPPGDHKSRGFESPTDPIFFIPKIKSEKVNDIFFRLAYAVQIFGDDKYRISV